MKVVIGVDVGGTHTKLGAVSTSGACLNQSIFNTPRSINTFLKTLKAHIQNIQAHTHIVGLAVGAPSVNSLTKKIEAPPNLGWGEVPLAKCLEETFAIPIHLMNDADAAAIGEWKYGKAKGLQDLIYITLGTGLGSALVLGGRLLEGAHGISAELGHVQLIKNGRTCNCGKKGCLEGYVSARGLKRTTVSLLRKGKSSLLAQYSSKTLTARHIIEAANRKDPLAVEAFQRTGAWLGEKLAEVVNITGCTNIFIAGGVSKGADVLLPATEKTLRAHVLVQLQDKVQISCSSLLANNPAILGAAHMLWRKLSL